MHPSHMRSLVDGVAFGISFVCDHHVEMMAPSVVRPDVMLYLTVTAKEGAMIESGSTLEELVEQAHSLYLTVRKHHGEAVGEMEMIPQGVFVPPFAANVHSLVLARAS